MRIYFKFLFTAEAQRTKRKEQSAWRKALKVSRRQPSGRYALCALLHAIIHLRPSAVN